MGVSITSPGTGGSWTIGHTPKVLSGLEYLGFPGVDAKQTARNYANDFEGLENKANGVIVGAPIYAAGYAELNGFAVGDRAIGYIQTDVTETATMSVYVVGANADTLTNTNFRPSFVSNGRTPAIADSGRTTEGFSLYAPSNDTAPAIAAASGRWSGSAANTGAHSIAIPLAKFNMFNMYEALVGNTYRRLRVTNLGLSSEPATTIARDPGTGKLRIGASFNYNQGKCRVAAVAIYSRILSDAEGTLVINDLVRIATIERGLTLAAA